MKKQIRQLLQRRKLSALADLASRRRRVLDLLVSLTFDPDPLVGWRAVEGMGAAADRIAEDDPDRVRQHLRRLHWLLSEESGGICWRAPEAMAEIVRLRPQIFADYVPIVVSLIDQMADEDLVHFRPGILWAIGRLGHLAEEEVEASLSTITACLDYPDCQVRGMASRCLQESGHGEILAERVDLLSDPGPVEIYTDGDLVRTTVGQLIREAQVAAD